MQSYPGRSSFGIGGVAPPGPPPSDVIALVAVVFVTFSMQFFATTAPLVAALRLTPLVFAGWLWQLVTYPFAGAGGASLWILLDLLVLFWFARDVFWALGRRRFWRTLVVSTAVGAFAACLINLLGGGGLVPFVLMQGQRMLIAVLIAAFATRFGDATILLFFVLPIQARWFIGIEIAFAFIGFLGSRDFAGFAGICVAIGVAWLMVSGGGSGRELHRLRKRAEQRLLEWRLKRMRRSRGFDVIEGGGNGRDRKDPWIN